MKNMKKHIITAILCLISGTLSAQIDPVSWSHEVKETAERDVYEVTFSATIASPWHMYDLGPYPGLGPNATAFEFTPAEGVEPLGELKQVIEPKRIEDPIFQMEIGYFAGQAVFSQSVKTTAAEPTTWGVTVSYQVCDDQSCLAPAEYDFFVAPSFEAFDSISKDYESRYKTVLAAERDAFLAGGIPDQAGALNEFSAGLQ